MQPFRLAQISDTHLSRGRPFFQHNWEVLVAHLNADPPDLVVCTGDMTLDAADRPEDLAFAAAEFRRITAPVLFVPGNHDIGNSHPDVRGGEILITAARRAAFCAAFGDDHWVRDAAPGWRFIGLNSMLPGSGLAAEAGQAALLQEGVAGAGARRVAVFQHKPLYMREPEEAVPSQSALYPAHRAALAAVLAGARGPVTVLSGHIHEYIRTRRWGRLRQVWAPAASFVMDIHGRSKRRYGLQRPGYLLHEFAADGAHRHTMMEPDGLILFDVGNWFRKPEGFHAAYAREPLRGLQLATGLAG